MIADRSQQTSSSTVSVSTIGSGGARAGAGGPVTLSTPMLDLSREERMNGQEKLMSMATDFLT
jgi:hypothetical protein